MIRGFAGQASSAGEAGETVVGTGLTSVETFIHEETKTTTERTGEVEKKIARIAAGAKFKSEAYFTALMAGRTYLLFGFIVPCSRNAPFCLVVHYSVVSGQVTGEAISVVSAVYAVVWTFVATHTLHVHQISRLTLALTGTLQTEVEPLNARRADSCIETHRADGEARSSNHRVVIEVFGLRDASFGGIE